MEYRQDGGTHRVTISPGDPKPTNASTGFDEQGRPLGVQSAPKVSAKWVGGVHSVTFTKEGPDNHDVIRSEQMPHVQAGQSQQEQTPANDVTNEDILATARSKWGSRGVTDKAVVTVRGIDMDIGIAVRKGYLAKDEHGGYYQPGREGTHSSRQQQPASQVTQQHQQRQELPKQDETPAAEKAPDLSQESNGLVTELVSKVANVSVTQAVREMTSGEPLSENSIGQLATQLGVEPEEVQRRASALNAEFTKQANDIMTKHASGEPEGADDVFAWARDHAPTLLKQAVNDHVHYSKSDGYQRLYQAYIEALPEHFPNVILNSADAKYWGVQREPNGAITVQIPGRGRMEWKYAVRRGFISPKPWWRAR